LSRSEDITGENVSASKSAPVNAKPYVSAIGPKTLPSTPFIVNNGKNAATMIAEAKKMGAPTSCAAWTVARRTPNE